MTWSTIEDAWGNDVDENINNFYKTNHNNTYNVNNSPSHLNNQLEQQQIEQHQIEQHKLESDKIDKHKMEIKKLEDQQKQELNKNKFYHMVERRLNLLEKNSSFVNNKIDKLSLRIESEIKSLGRQLNNLDFPKQTYHESQENNYSQNMNDIILFIIFGIFILILMDSMYRLLQLKIKNI
tara:strand:- start:318 stop:857 length:540 start_codon:yes stop_codon:yes gene_type:complete